MSAEPFWKEYLIQDSNGDLWVICSPNETYASARYLDTTGRKLYAQDVRKLTSEDEQAFQKAIKAARIHHNVLIFAGST